jgi:hypothetical protein
LPGVQTRQRRWEDELRLKALLVGRNELCEARIVCEYTSY